MPPKRAASKVAKTEKVNKTADTGKKKKPAASTTSTGSKKTNTTVTKKIPTTKVTGKRKASDVDDIEDVKPAAKRGRPTAKPHSKAASKSAPATKSKQAESSVSVTKSTTKSTASKRKSPDDEETEGPPVKRARGHAAIKKTNANEKKPIKDTEVVKKPAARQAAAPKATKVLPDINNAPTNALHVFVFGEGSQGELGLGTKNEPGRAVIDVRRPRLNARLEDLNVVQIAVGGMHCAALTADNKIYTWGVNDQGALGRETSQEGKMRDITKDNDEDDSDSDSEDEDSGLNPSEAEPRQVDPNNFPEGTRFASLYAGDSTTFALTTTGLVYGWGTFRGNDGVLGFTKDNSKGDGKKTQAIPKLVPELKRVQKMAVGTNHALALTEKGKAFVWGAGEQSQLGRRVVARTATGGLVPREFGFQRKQIVDIATGDYFSYAVEKNGTIYAWGHNGYGQTGIPTENNVDDIIPVPTIVENLKDRNITQLAGGNHHTIARTGDGEVLVWGRLDNSEGGLKFEDMPQASLVRDPASNRVLASKEPITVPNLKAQLVATGTDTNFVITEQGQAYSWGFSTNYQTGLGTSDDVAVATLVDNAAVREKKLTFAGVGGQFGVLACEKEVVISPGN